MVYVDDTVVYFKRVEGHLKHRRNVLSLLHAAEATLKQKKCNLFAEKIDYLGNNTRRRRLELPKTTSEAVRNLKDPKSQTDLRPFLGLCNVFRRFVPSVFRTTVPLKNKLNKDQPKHFRPLADKEKEAVE